MTDEKDVWSDMTPDRLIDAVQRTVEVLINLRGRIRKIDDLLLKLSMSSMGLGAKWRKGEMVYYNDVRDELMTEYTASVMTLSTLLILWHKRFPFLRSQVLEDASAIWRDANEYVKQQEAE